MVSFHEILDRLDKQDRKLDKQDQKLDKQDQKLDKQDQKLDKQDQKLDTILQFLLLNGTQGLQCKL